MPTIKRIHPNIEEKLIKLRDIDDSIFNDMILALNKSTPSIFYANLAEQIFPQLTNINITDLQDVLGSVFTFFSAHKRRELKNEDIVQQVIKLIEDGKTEKIKFDNKEQSEVFNKRMLTLLNSEVLALTFEAAEVYYNQKNLFSSASIDVDIRPIFAEGKTNFAVLHNLLHIDFNSEGEPKSLYIALDKEDIKKFKMTIEDAEQKIKIAESLIEKMGMKELQIREEE